MEILSLLAFLCDVIRCYASKDVGDGLTRDNDDEFDAMNCEDDDDGDLTMTVAFYGLLDSVSALFDFLTQDNLRWKLLTIPTITIIVVKYGYDKYYGKPRRPIGASTIRPRNALSHVTKANSRKTKNGQKTDNKKKEKKLKMDVPFSKELQHWDQFYWRDKIKIMFWWKVWSWATFVQRWLAGKKKRGSTADDHGETEGQKLDHVEINGKGPCLDLDWEKSPVAQVEEEGEEIVLCRHCGVTLNKEDLLICYKCLNSPDWTDEMAYYCSDQCCKMDWKSGHKLEHAELTAANNINTVD